MTKHLDDQALTDLTERYMAMWTEADPHERARRVADVWAPGGAQVLVDPPQAVREATAALAFPAPRLEVRGHDEIGRRVAAAYSMFVADATHTFRAAADAVLLAPALVGLRWQMVALGDGTVTGGGYDVMTLDADGRVVLDHQHIVSS